MNLSLITIIIIHILHIASLMCLHISSISKDLATVQINKFTIDATFKINFNFSDVILVF